MSNIDQKAKTKLAELLSAVQPVIKGCIKQMSQREVEYILENYSKFLKLDLERDFQEVKKEVNSDSNNIDDLFSGLTKDKD
jgi:uncharacterized protein YgbK (DUF1537 family)